MLYNFRIMELLPKVLIALSLIILFPVQGLAASESLVITLNKSSLTMDKYAEDTQYVDELIKEVVKGKIKILPSDEYLKTLNSYALTDMSVAERGDIVSAMQGTTVKYIIITSLREVFTQYVEIHCRVIDVRKNRYLLNRVDREMGGPWASRNTIRKAFPNIKAELEKLAFGD